MGEILERSSSWIEQIAEANERIAILSELGYMENIASVFLSDGIACVTDWTRPVCGEKFDSECSIYSFAALEIFEPDVAKAIREFEEESRCCVYAAIYREVGDIRAVCILYVSKYVCEWEFDKQELKDGTPFVCVVNLDDPDDSVYCYVSIGCSNGGLDLVRGKPLNEKQAITEE